MCPGKLGAISESATNSLPVTRLRRRCDDLLLKCQRLLPRWRSEIEFYPSLDTSFGLAIHSIAFKGCMTSSDSTQGQPPLAAGKSEAPPDPIFLIPSGTISMVEDLQNHELHAFISVGNVLWSDLCMVADLLCVILE